VLRYLQVKRAFRTLRTKAHPDKGGDAEQFNALVKAHAVLSDPEKVGTL
jgi:DnaJ-class molecular chaperone